MRESQSGDLVSEVKIGYTVGIERSRVMGLYLNSKRAQSNYREIVQSAYFVDKTLLLEELIPIVGDGEGIVSKSGRWIGKSGKYVCITRPRRFGKTVMANMIAAYFGKGSDCGDIFERLNIRSCEQFGRHLNQHNVIYITLNEVPSDCGSYRQYISRIEKRLLADLGREFPGICTDEAESLWDALNIIFELEEKKFIFVLDEWDYIFHKDFVTESDRNEYIGFLSNLLKDQPYAELVYMTGVLPIAKYSSGSELNMFMEYTMVTEERFCEYFGFTEAEVDELYTEYLALTEEVKVTREGLRLWYDGYHTASGGRLYNPRSVVGALTNNNLGNYWTSSGPYDEIFYYVKNNVDDIRDALALMISGEAISAKIREYAATSMRLRTKEEIFSAMVVYGFLSSENGKVSIPNQELMARFEDMLLKESSLGYVYRLAKESERMLQATLRGDTDTMLEILEYAHNTETPLLSYSNETELTAVVNLVYLSARDQYWIEREDKSGTGYVDFIFYPKSVDADGIILELKVDHTPDEALRQIKERRYDLKLRGKLEEESRCSGRILAVGITFDRKRKVHSCKIEVM